MPRPHPRIAVLGATGNVGGAVLHHLGAASIVPRVSTRRASVAWPVPVEPVVGDFADRACLDRLFAGVERAFLVSTIEADPRIDQRVLEAAVAAGVRHVVKLSTIGVDAESELGRRHRVRERAIEESGMGWTFVRPGFFMSNALQWRDGVRTGTVYAPAADGAIAPISPRDIGEVAVRALLDPASHAGKAYALTGDTLTTAREMVRILAAVLGKDLTCASVEPAAAATAARAHGMPDWLAATLETLWTSVAAGGAGIRTPTVREVTGHAAEDFETWARANAAAFSLPASDPPDHRE